MDPEILHKKFKPAYHEKNPQNIFYDKKVPEKCIFKCAYEYAYICKYKEIDWKSNKMITCMDCSGVVGYKELPNYIQYFYVI